MSQGFLLVPAEGRPSNRDDEFPLLSWESRAMESGQFQWVWAFDRTTLGLVGRLGLDAWASGPADSIAWVSADEEAGLLYASSFGNRVGEIVEVKVFRLPGLGALRGEAPSSGPAISVQHRAKTLLCDYLGSLPLRDVDGAVPHIRGVQGGVVTPGGRLYLNFNKSDKDPNDQNAIALGVLEFDLLSGRATNYLALGHYNDLGIWLQGLAAVDDRLLVLIWDEDVTANEYTVVQCAPRHGPPL